MSREKIQQHKLVFYLDECLGGNKVYSSLKGAGLNVELHSAHFARGTPDTEWLAVVGKRGWILLTQDKAIRWHKHEISVLREFNLKAFIITAKNLRGEEIGALIVEALPKIYRLIKNTEPPFVAVINRSNIVELREGKQRSIKKF